MYGCRTVYILHRDGTFQCKNYYSYSIFGRIRRERNVPLRNTGTVLPAVFPFLKVMDGVPEVYDSHICTTAMTV